MKRNLSNTTLIILLLCFAPITILAEDVEIDGIRYSLVKKIKEATVINKEFNYSGTVVIPSTVEYEDIEYSVTSIGNGAFSSCSSLTSVIIPNSVTSIGQGAFQRCTGLKSVTISSNVTCLKIYTFYGCSSLTSITIPNSVTSIEDNVFSYSGLTSVIIPNSLTSIGEKAFSFCSRLTSVHISDIAAWCNISFKGDESNPLYFAHHLYLNDLEITDLVIPSNVTSIGDYAFERCDGLTSVNIPNSVTSVGYGAFNWCSKLTSVTIPNSMTSIGDNAFSGCTGLTSVNIPNSVTNIERGAFSGCTGLTSVNIPNSVTNIERGAFYGCTDLKSVTIGNGVKSIKETAFSNCSELESVTIYATDVPKTASDAFDNSYVDHSTLMVPDESLDAYKSTKPWSLFGTINGNSGTVIEKEKCATPTIYYSYGKLTFECETEGVEYSSSITDTDIRSYTTAAIDLGVTYTITVYATKAGYEDSDVATATLCWIDVDPKTEGLTTDATQVMAKAVMIQGHDGILSISGADKGSDIAIYSASGQKMGLAKADTNTTSIATHLQKGDVAIVKIGEKSIKVVMQ